MLVAVGIETISALYCHRRRPAAVHAEGDSGGGPTGAAEKPAVPPAASRVTAAGPDNQSKPASRPPRAALLRAEYGPIHAAPDALRPRWRKYDVRAIDVDVFI